MIFHVNRIETQNDNVFLPFYWSWSEGWKRGTNRIREHWFWWLRRLLLHTSKFTFMSWLLDSLDLLSRKKDTHWLISRVVYGFNQGSVVSFVINKLEKVYIYFVILMYSMQIYFHLSWSGNKFTDFVVFLNFF